MDPLAWEAAKTYLRSVAIGVTVSLFFVSYFGLRPLPPLLAALIFGLPFGLAFPFVLQVASPRLRFRSFLLTILAQTALILAVITGAFLLSLMIYLVVAIGRPPWDPEVWGWVMNLAGNGNVLIAAASTFLLVVLIRALFEISRKLGPGVLLNWVTGKYHTPREEPRIFMFLDMKDSTALAERLGALRFSALVRDFFDDLTDPVILTQGEVSHYIGDEAVLTWTMPRGLTNGNCLRLVRLFRQRLASRSEHYLGAYGLVPEFKAGMHSGPVVATEVGRVKSEVVYHGDVLNTTARLTGLCSELGQDLLVSGDLAAQLPAEGLVSLGWQRLRGKEQRVEVFAPTS